LEDWTPYGIFEIKEKFSKLLVVRPRRRPIVEKDPWYRER